MMSNSQNSVVNAFGSPIKAPSDEGHEPITVKRLIKLKTVSETSPSSTNCPANCPANCSAKSVDVSFETPVFDFFKVLAELERTEEAGSVRQKEESFVSVANLPDISVSTLPDISADESVDPVSTLPDISADESVDPVSTLPDISADESVDPVSTLPDISAKTIGLANEHSPSVSFATPNYSRWLVAIDFLVLISLTNFPLSEHFEKVADIQIDEELQIKSTNTKKAGEKARQTFIRFVTVISKKIWSEEAEWIYMFVVDGMIVKIGGTRTGLLKRCGSYLSGHGIPELGGNSNSTNAKIYWTFLHLLLQGKSVEMYACRLPEAVVTQTVFGSTKVIRTQCFHDWEAYCLEEFAKLYGSFPPLSDNCDPRHRKEKGNVKKKM
jgi:hypothetical protein